jgi:hypothetical protein
VSNGTIFKVTSYRCGIGSTALGFSRLSLKQIHGIRNSAFSKYISAWLEVLLPNIHTSLRPAENNKAFSKWDKNQQRISIQSATLLTGSCATEKNLRKIPTFYP